LQVKEPLPLLEIDLVVVLDTGAQQPKSVTWKVIMCLWVSDAQSMLLSMYMCGKLCLSIS